MGQNLVPRVSIEKLRKECYRLAFELEHGFTTVEHAKGFQEFTKTVNDTDSGSVAKVIEENLTPAITKAEKNSPVAVKK